MTDTELVSEQASAWGKGEGQALESRRGGLWGLAARRGLRGGGVGGGGGPRGRVEALQDPSTHIHQTQMHAILLPLDPGHPHGNRGQEQTCSQAKGWENEA